MAVREAADLQRILQRIDGRGYGAYKDCEGAYAFEGYTLWIDHVQADPFAAPSRVRVSVPASAAGFPRGCCGTKDRTVALRDFLARSFAAAGGGRRRGSGRSGEIAVALPGQEILERSSVVATADGDIEVRFLVGLPARGRTVLGGEAAAVFFEEIPARVASSLHYKAVDAGALYRHLAAFEDYRALQAALPSLGLVAFVADGAVLPRQSGVDDRPLSGAVPFRSPPSLRVEVDLPHAGTVGGMGVPEGITLIVGGGFHGKSTLLRAIERGVYAHIPGDGRERVASLPSTVKIRAEDGRRVEGVDISPFIAGLPDRRETRAFSTENASGSTSQAANIMEALEVGAGVLLIDEDTAATNMMIRDRRMQALVPDDLEPITPFIDRARSLFCDCDVSTVLVIGGSGDYFDIADTVVCMARYHPEDATARAQALAVAHPSGRPPPCRREVRHLPPPHPRSQVHRRQQGTAGGKGGGGRRARHQIRRPRDRPLRGLPGRRPGPDGGDRPRHPQGKMPDGRAHQPAGGGRGGGRRNRVPRPRRTRPLSLGWTRRLSPL